MAISMGDGVVDRPGGEARLPSSTWILWAVVLASTCVIVGLLWDISWHRTIGRDSFLTPAHTAIYLGGLVAGLSCGWLVLRTTFGESAEARAASVRFWGFRGPLGAWVCIWGTFAMLTSAPFDNWWHNAYGLDVQILSPPHVVLALGMVGIEIGAMLMVLARQNCSGGAVDTRYSWVYLYTAGIALLMTATIVWEDTGFPNSMHSASFYEIAAAAFPILLVAAGRAGRVRWPATTVAGVYSGITLAMMWILQLCPAEPKLAPVYNHVTHMNPPTFPMLLVLPALAFDVLLRRFGSRRDWLLALVLGLAFLFILLPVQWFFGEFLMSKAARNFLFAANHWDYSSHLGPWRYEYWDLDRDLGGQWSAALFVRRLGTAAILGVASSRVGLWWGSWMSRVMR